MMPAVLGVPSARIAAKDGAVVVVVLDLACCLGLVVLMAWLANAIDESERGGGKETLSASDYHGVRRAGLPAGATREEIVEHFSTLYALDRPDWEFPGTADAATCGRRAPRCRVTSQTEGAWR